ncbi:electron transport complex subunit RsxC [Pleionea sp. CnH1-48]|uniref:electron transport complex subunit RsxC n=1 Tax=Pleionea sp. CnH1-48 TaxID=2954494 RepID=UPI002096A28A|nr:electron transport complex subunit RsxC [Pleionea sp. CnH1-48]MCO7222922.1 electron transport complex subunit RsxC [Pleionea sp. CnH1-48]
MNRGNDIIFHSSYQIHGGIHPPENKAQSNQSPIQDLPIPPQLVYPLLHNDRPLTPTVEVGERVLAGQIIADGKEATSANLHAGTSGIVSAIEEHSLPHPSSDKGQCLVITADGADEWAPRSALKSAFEQPREALLEHINQAGIAGLGGAVFPSHIKLASQVETLIVNAAECEPYITCDDRLMREQASELITAIELVLYLASAKQCVIGIEDNKPEAIAALEEAIQLRKKETDLDIRIGVVPTRYPSGGEKQLIELLTGQQVPQNQRPSALGLLVHNVATLYAIYQAIVLGQPLISRVVTLTGDAATKPGNYRVRLGTPINWLLEQTDTQPYERCVMGGPMMGFELKDLSAPVVKATNCIIAAGKNELSEPSQALACIRCGECADACPASLLPQQLYWFSRAKDFEKTRDYNLFDCIECGACAWVCPSHIPLVQYYRFAKTEIRAQDEEKRKADAARKRHEFRTMRLERDKKERAERHKKAAEKRKNAAQSKGEVDEKKATVADAIARARAKKKAAKDSSS